MYTQRARRRGVDGRTRRAKKVTFVAGGEGTGARSERDGYATICYDIIWHAI